VGFDVEAKVYREGFRGLECSKEHDRILGYGTKHVGIYIVLK